MKLFTKKTAEEKRRNRQHLLEAMEETARYMVFMQNK